MAGVESSILHHRSIDLTGQIFGRWTVLRFAGRRSNGKNFWLCRCECGAEKEIVTQGLRGGDSKSCGCLHKEIVSEISRGRLCDLTGQTFGRLTVIAKAESRKGQTRWLCQCECGARTEAHASHLQNGHTQSCGCLSAELAATRQLMDLTGKTFGRLTVIGYAGRLQTEKPQRRTMWLCRCQCGTEKAIYASSLVRGLTQSCGCLHRERTSEAITTHGKSGSDEHNSWGGMRVRCLHPSDEAYVNYGARGITICAHWITSFENFLADMGIKPTSKHTIERIDNNGNYSCGHCSQCLANGWPFNCRWATRKEQQNNRRGNRVLTFNGMSLTVAQWSEHLGFKVGVIFTRLRLGWSVEKSLTTPVNQHRNAIPSVAFSDGP